MRLNNLEMRGIGYSMRDRILELAKEAGLITYDSDNKMLQVEQFAKLLVDEVESYIEESEGDIDFVRFLIDRRLKEKKSAGQKQISGGKGGGIVFEGSGGKGGNVLKILANRIMTPDGTILESMHRHDYKTYIDKNGLEYMVDGGLEYTRRIVHDDAPYIEMSVYNDDDHLTIREAFKWGTRGVDGKQPLTYLVLKDMATDHIEAILETQTHITEEIRQVFIDELEYRYENT